MRDPSFCELGVTLPQQVLNSMRKTYLPGDFVYHLAGGGLHGSVKTSTGLNPKYRFLTTVCNAHSLDSTPAQRSDVEIQLAIFTDRSRSVLKQPWPPIAQQYAGRVNPELQAQLSNLARLQAGSHMHEYNKSRW